MCDLGSRVDLVSIVTNGSTPPIVCARQSCTHAMMLRMPAPLSGVDSALATLGVWSTLKCEDAMMVSVRRTPVRRAM